MSDVSDPVSRRSEGFYNVLQISGTLTPVLNAICFHGRESAEGRIRISGALGQL
jgi:hypothetical protein